MSILKLIRRHKPTTAKDMEDVLGVDLISIGHGASREAFAISGTRMVVKFQFEGDTSLAQTRREIRRIKQILRRKSLRHVRRYVPKIYYTDYKNGIIIMEMLNRVGKVSSEASQVVEHMLCDTFPCLCNCADASGENLGYDGRGQIKLLDWGCV